MEVLETIEQTIEGPGGASPGPPVPGLVLVFSGGSPRASALPLASGALEIGRGSNGNVQIDDTRMSRRHGRVSYDGARWTVADLGSRNGTAVDSQAVEGEWRGAPRIIRMGATLFLPVADIRPYASGVSERAGLIIGARMAETWQAIVRAARLGGNLHISGESGAGKEGAARAFHGAGPHPDGPFIAVNCAAIPEGVAERLLFGARRGAYSGANADADGYVQAADGGTLFLDEVAELDLAVQAKLLRVLETREVLPLGASKPRPVDIRLCSATHKDLRQQVTKGRLREDLYFRISRPEVLLPPLRERLEEVPWLISRVLKQVDPSLRPTVSLVETCLVRHWPGNVRELLAEVRSAGQAALEDGGAVDAKHLSPSAGVAFTEAPAAGTAGGTVPPARGEPPTKEQLEEALRRAGGNVSATARSLGVHRTQLRRWMARYQIQGAAEPGGAPADEGPEQEDKGGDES